MDIKEALSQLDALDDEQWTDDGSVRIDVLSKMVGRKLNRAEIIGAAPKFTRENQDLSALDDEPEVETPIQAQTEPEEDTSVLQKFSQADPMEPEDFARKILAKIPDSQLVQVQQMLEIQLAEIRAKKNEIDEIERKVKLCNKTTENWIKNRIPDTSNQQAIQEFLKKQNEIRAEKAESVRTVLNGLKAQDLTNLDPRAPIDRAFARRTGRGNQRPSR